MRIEGVRFLESPNRSSRQGRAVDAVVIHHISLPPGVFGGDCVERFFMNELDWSEHPFFSEIRGVEVSAHFFIKRTGEAVQFVDTEEAAWHAGAGALEGEEAVNLFSVGIELEGDEATPYTDSQYETLSTLIDKLRAAHPGIVVDRIVGHEHVAPGRKTDPGPLFDWSRLKKSLKTASERSRS